MKEVYCEKCGKKLLVEKRAGSGFNQETGRRNPEYIYLKCPSNFSIFFMEFGCGTEFIMDKNGNLSYVHAHEAYS